MHRFHAVLSVALVMATALAAGCGTTPARVPAGVVSVKLGFQASRTIPTVRIRVGQPLLVRTSPRLEPLQLAPASALGRAQSPAPDCSPGRCYLLVAKRPGRIVLSAPFRCVGTERACARAVALVYVEAKAGSTS